MLLIGSERFGTDPFVGNIASIAVRLAYPSVYLQIFSSALEDATLARLGAGRTISHSVLESLDVAVKLAPRQIVSLTRTGNHDLAMQPLSEDVLDETENEPDLDVGRGERSESVAGSEEADATNASAGGGALDTS